jgi:hypothetical protein
MAGPAHAAIQAARSLCSPCGNPKPAMFAQADPPNPPPRTRGRHTSTRSSAGLV